MDAFDRRKFIVFGSTGMAAACLPTPWRAGGQALAAAAPAPHYFLEIFFPGGMDCLYTFDARPLAMTKAGLIANYMTEEPEVLTGTNGNTALATKLIQPLKPHLDRFSVLNGVIMVPGFDGHDNNTNYLLSGNPFGGESMLPHLNQVGNHTPIDFVEVGGQLFGNVTNMSNSVPLTPKSADSFAQRLAHLSALNKGSDAMTFLKNRMTAGAAGSGRFSAGSKAMNDAFSQVPDLAESLKVLKATNEGMDEAEKIAGLIGELFKHNLCKSVQLVIDSSLIPNIVVDTHDGKSAKDSPAMVDQCMTALAKIISHLRDTAFDSKNSLLDVTTVLVGTEFGRTMRSSFGGGSVTEGGTDHNPLKNTILIGGKGIKGGLIAGGTDRQTSDEVISAAHKGLDPDSIKVMGRPLNFATLAPADGLPAEFHAADYLDFGCIANTVYQLFGAPPSRYRSIERNGPPAKVLDALLG